MRRLSSIWVTCISICMTCERRLSPGNEAAKYAEEAIPPDRRLPEIRKKIGSLEQLGPIPKSPAARTP